MAEEVKDTVAKSQDVGDTEECTSGETEESLYTVEDMARLINVKIGTLKDWTKLKENPCPCYRYKTRFLRFDRAAVMTWLAERTKEFQS